MPTDVENLVAARSSLIQALATEAAAQVTGGAKPSYSIDGELVSWDQWRTATMGQIQALTQQIRQLGGPFRIRSRGRS
jgi:hypothetical protein